MNAPLKPMPDIDSLMAEWPMAVETLLSTSGLPNADFECDVLTFVDLVCAVCDIPVYKSRIQSLHVLFTLYSAFKHSQHFGASGVTAQPANFQHGLLENRSSRPRHQLPPL